MLTYFLYGLFILSCVVLVVTVLLQPGKADAGALFSSSVSSTALAREERKAFLARSPLAPRRRLCCWRSCFRCRLLPANAQCCSQQRRRASRLLCNSLRPQRPRLRLRQRRPQRVLHQRALHQVPARRSSPDCCRGSGPWLPLDRLARRPRRDAATIRFDLCRSGGTGRRARLRGV